MKRFEVVTGCFREMRLADSVEEVMKSLVVQLRAERVGSHAVEFPDGSKAVVFEAEQAEPWVKTQGLFFYFLRYIRDLSQNVNSLRQAIDI